MNYGLKPGATPADTLSLLRAVLAGFTTGATSRPGFADPAATSLPTNAERMAWRSGWMAGVKAQMFLLPNIEHTQQRALFEWLLVCERTCPELELTYAVPNGGLRAKAVAGKLKAEGVKAGVPDVCLPLAAGTHSALYIEMKAKEGSVSADQKDRIARMSAAGNRVVVCKSWHAAATEVVEYMALRHAHQGACA